MTNIKRFNMPAIPMFNLVKMWILQSGRNRPKTLNSWLREIREYAKVASVINSLAIAAILLFSSCTGKLYQREVDPVSFKVIGKWEAYKPIASDSCNKFYMVQSFPIHPR